MMHILALLLLGACIGTGLAVIAVTALTPTQPPAPGPDDECGSLMARTQELGLPRARRLALPAAAGVAALVLTGWPVAAVLAGSGTYFLPGLLRSGHGTQARVARIEAVASWTELLRDTLSASAGLYEAIRATGVLAPDPIRPATTRLAERLARPGTDPQAALRALADEIADPVADRVVIALGFAVANPTRDLAALLGALAANAREQAAMGGRIQTARARTRTAVRVIVGVTLGLGAALALLDRSFLVPYNSGFGQLALTVIGGMFASGFARLRRLSELPEAPRLLPPTSTVPAPRTAAEAVTSYATVEGR